MIYVIPSIKELFILFVSLRVHSQMLTGWMQHGGGRFTESSRCLQFPILHAQFLQLNMSLGRSNLIRSLFKKSGPKLYMLCHFHKCAVNDKPSGYLKV